MSILWAFKGTSGNKGFWDFSVAEQKTMAEWVATDSTADSQVKRAETELKATRLDKDTFVAVLSSLESENEARGILGSDVHASGFLVKNGRIHVYDSMEGAVTINESVQAFANNMDNYAEMYSWNTFLINS